MHFIEYICVYPQRVVYLQYRNSQNDIIMKTQVYEIKVNGKWSKVRSTGMKALSDWAKENNVSDWRMSGMMSRNEMLESQSLKVVA